MLPGHLLPDRCMNQNANPHIKSLVVVDQNDILTGSGLE